jgi:hypothetical protein
MLESERFLPSTSRATAFDAVPQYNDINGIYHYPCDVFRFQTLPLW